MLQNPYGYKFIDIISYLNEKLTIPIQRVYGLANRCTSHAELEDILYGYARPKTIPRALVLCIDFCLGWTNWPDDRLDIRPKKINVYVALSRPTVKCEKTGSGFFFFFFFFLCQIWAKNLLKFVFNGLKKHLYMRFDCIPPEFSPFRNF